MKYDIDLLIFLLFLFLFNSNEIKQKVKLVNHTKYILTAQIHVKFSISLQFLFSILLDEAQAECISGTWRKGQWINLSVRNSRRHISLDFTQFNTVKTVICTVSMQIYWSGSFVRCKYYLYRSWLINYKVEKQKYLYCNCL